MCKALSVEAVKCTLPQKKLLEEEFSENHLLFPPLHKAQRRAL